MIIDRAIAVPMRDGNRLAADLYRSGAAFVGPVVLERTPYGRDRCDQAEQVAGQTEPPARDAVAAAYVAAGFAYMVQDCRGTGGSEGEFSKYLQEPDDGVDTVDWLIRQPWCDGRIGMVGFSYAAMCQIGVLAAGERRILGAVADCGGFADAWRSGIRQGGAFDLKQATWGHAQALRMARASGDSDAEAALAAEDLGAWLKRGPWRRGHSPLGTAPDIEAAVARFWQAPADDPIWRHPSLAAERASEDPDGLSILHITGWFDTSLRNTVENFSRHDAAKGVANAGLIVGPWTHGDRHRAHAGDLAFGDEALPEIGLGGSIPDLRLAWLKRALGGGPPQRSVRVFAMGGGPCDRDLNGRIRYGGAWLAPEGWPDAKSEGHRLFPTADGRLDEEGGGAGERSFTHDPDDPVPTVGGAINSGEPIMQGGPFDQRTRPGILGARPPFSPLADRPDVLRFETAPLADDLLVAGPVEARIWVSVDRPDADLVIRLCDIFEVEGETVAIGLCDGIQRLRWRDDTGRPVVPGSMVPVRVRAFPTAARFVRGHRLGLDICGSNFPHFDINPFGMGPGDTPAQAEVTLHLGGKTPSSLDLTVLPASRACLLQRNAQAPLFEQLREEACL